MDDGKPIDEVEWGREMCSDCPATGLEFVDGSAEGVFSVHPDGRVTLDGEEIPGVRFELPPGATMEALDVLLDVLRLTAARLRVAEAEWDEVNSLRDKERFVEQYGMADVADLTDEQLRDLVGRLRAFAVGIGLGRDLREKGLLHVWGMLRERAVDGLVADNDGETED